MRNTRLTKQALSLATTESARDAYICRACLAQTTRQLSTSAPRCAASAEPFYKRIQSTIFGTRTRAAEDMRDAARKKQVEKIQEAGPEKKAEKEKVELLNGEVYEVAEVVDPVTHKDYVVSKTWKGMERIGGEEWIKARADGGEKYVGFMPAKQVKLNLDDWDVLLHTITAEVLTLRKAGRDVLQVCNARTFDDSNRTVTRGVGVSNEKGDLVLELDTQERAILASISETSQQEERDPEALKAELAEALASGGGRLFMALKLDDPRVKLAILKRTMQLTGKRIPDMLLSKAKTLEHLHRAFVQKEVPKKLHETTQLQMLSETPNIQVHESRRTHVHKDKAIGRWKLIEDEMTLRNMPTRGGGNVVARDALLS